MQKKQGMKKQCRAEEMEQVIQEGTLSKKSVREFCSRVGIAAYLLRYWMKRMKKGGVGFSAVETKEFSELKINISGI